MQLPIGPALLANPWTICVLGALLVGSYGVVGYKAYRAGQNQVIAETARLIENEVRVREAAIAGAAEAIAKIEVRNVTIRQKAETVTREVPVYRDCRHDGDGLRLLNEALSPGAQSAPESKLPGTDAAD